MTDALIAYLMDDLSPERRAEVDAKLASDPAWRWELERLQECMAAHGDVSKCAEEPPQDLVKKTCCFVEDSASGKFNVDKKSKKPVATASFTSASLDSGAARRWSLADVTIVAGVLMMVGALAMPALYDSRDASRRITCTNNLKDLGNAIFNYAENFEHRTPSVQPGEPAAMCAVELLSRRVISHEQLMQLLVCPESDLADRVFTGQTVMVMPSRRHRESEQGQQLLRTLRFAGGSLAYRVGYLDDRGNYRPIAFTGSEDSPVLADAAIVSSGSIRSANHGGRGQNVLYQDLHVEFRRNCVLPSEDDPIREIYVNEQGLPAAGNSADDVVMLGLDQPLRLITRPDANWFFIRIPPVK